MINLLCLLCNQLFFTVFVDVDVTPTTSQRKCNNGIERILEFGRDLSQMGQQLEKENKMTEEDRQMLEVCCYLHLFSFICLQSQTNN